MKVAFLSTLNPMLVMFFCIAIGFILKKTNIMSDGASKVTSKLVTWVFAPALYFNVTAKFCTPDSIASNAFAVSLGAVVALLGLGIATALSFAFVRTKSPERGVYAYALAFANLGYVGDPLVLSMFGEQMLSVYKMFTLPFSIIIYTWGIGVLTPSGNGNPLKRLLNAPTIALLLGVISGLSGVGAYIPSAIGSTLDTLGACMGPCAMLTAGFIVASYDFSEMLKNKKVYLATALRLFVLPTVLVGILFGITELIPFVFGIDLGNTVLYLALFATAAPLGLNTVVFPEAFGGNPKTGASMALISHTLCVVTIPIMYTLMTLIFGEIVPMA